MPKTKQCPCGSKKSYTLCCGRYHKGNIYAPTAESLMRSRYSAYILDKKQYTYRTWDENTRPTLKQLREGRSQKFIKLEIINTTKGNTNDETGTVEFIASYIMSPSNEIQKYHENGTFIQLKNRWYYVKSIDI